MTYEKQIEEMAINISYARGSVEHWHCRYENCNECKYKHCTNSAVAESLFEKGYRKASDIANDIFEEIETSLVIGGFVNGEKYIAIREDDYNHYKKKYTESEDTE